MRFQGGILNPSSLIVNVDNKVYQVAMDHPNWGRIKEAYKVGDCSTFLQLLDVKEAVKTYVDNNEVKESGVTINDNGDVFYRGEPVHNSVVEAIRRMLGEGFEIKPMVKFLENMMENPSYNSIKEMWNFIEQMGLTVTEDGCFLAYKTVRADYTDKFSGRIDNTPGQKPERMLRSQVDDNPRNHCSSGYHVGALGYAGPGGWYNSSGDRVIICKVNPADVVSVPNDHSYQKLRCCYYEPVGEFQGELKSVCYSGMVGENYGSVNSFIRPFSPDPVSPYDLLEDNFYIGTYTKSNGEVGERYFLVEEVHCDKGLYVVMLCEPEINASGHRNFYMDKLRDVRTWDGQTDPDSLSNPYDPWDDDEELCDYCGEPIDECDGYCNEPDDYEEYDYPNYW